MNFIDFVEVELRSLLKQSASSHKPVANKISKLLEQIIAMKESRGGRPEGAVDEEQKSLAAVGELLNILILTYETKNGKLTLQALDILRKIMNFKYLSKEHYEQILSQLILIRLTEDEKVQEKIIQICQYLIMPSLVDLHDCEFVLKLFTVCFQLSCSKQAFTQKIATSALLQLVELLFESERFQHYDEQEQKHALDLLAELLSYIVEGKSLRWVPKGMSGIVWDMVLEICRLQGGRCRSRPDVVAKLEKLLEHSRKCFVKQAENKKDWLRFYRAMVYLPVYLAIGIRQLHHLEIVSQVDRGFLLTVYLQGLLHILCSPNLCDMFDTNLELVTCFDVLARVAEDLCISHESLAVNDKRPRQYLSVPMVRVSLDGADSFDAGACYKMILQKLPELRQACECKFATGEQPDLKKSIDRFSPYLLRTYRYLISIEVEEDTMRKSISEFQLWFIVCSKNRLHKTKNRFLEELALLARKMDKRPQAVRSSQSLQVMFNLIYGYPDLLDSSCMSIVLRSLKDAEEAYHTHRATKHWEAEIGHELASVMNMVDHLYERGSVQLSEQSLKVTVEALNEVTLSVLEQLSEVSNTPSNTSEQSAALRTKTFGVRKMKTVIENNSQHIGSVWNFIVAHFISLCSCKFEDIRVSAVGILAQTISNLLVLGSIPPEQLLSIYLDIVKTKYVDVKTLVVSYLKIFLTDHGYKVGEQSLLQVMRILKLTDSQGLVQRIPPHYREYQELLRLMEAENDLNELVIKECLVNVVSSECLAELIANYRIISNNKNHEYSSVGLIWLIADHVKQLWTGKHSTDLYDTQFKDLTTQLFRKLQKLAVSNHYQEVRQSAIHIITQIIAEQLKLYDSAYLEFVLHQVYLPMFEQVSCTYLAKVAQPHQKIESDLQSEKDWLETSECAYSNLAKLVKRLKTEDLLNRAFIDRVMQRVSLNLEQPAQQIFYYLGLLFLKSFKAEVLDLEGQQHPEEAGIREKLADHLQKMDRKDRINRSKVLPELEELVAAYGNQ